VVGPVPLYSGTTFVSRHDWGGSYSTALSFKNVAMHAMPVGPRCFSSWRGRQLSPELLFALKPLLSTAVSSAGEMWWSCAWASGVNESAGMVSS
jgi:hypothetical protein